MSRATRLYSPERGWPLRLHAALLVAGYALALKGRGR